MLRVRETRLTTRDLGGNTVESRSTLVTFYSRVGLSAIILANESDEVIAGAYTIREVSGSGNDEIDRSDAALLPLYPNPFGDFVTIPFELGSPAAVQIRVFDVTGRYVATVVDDNFPPGRHAFTWRPVLLAPGVYVVRMGSGRVHQVHVAVFVPR